MRWAIVNAGGSHTKWHRDGGGSLTFLTVHSGKKLWVVQTVDEVGEITVEAFVLNAGDAA
jgi:hypothetical protein